MSRWGSTGVFDSSQLTAVKQTRNVYANALAQRTAVDKAGKPFMRIQSASAGEGGPVNGFSIASDTGALNLTQAEFDAIVAQETPGPSGPSGPPTLTFIFNGSGGTPLNISAIPAGYTSLAYILCGGGGGGSAVFDPYGPGSGGGSGGYRTGNITVSAGESISISFGNGGPGGIGGASDGTEDGVDGSGTILTYDGTPYSAGGGGGGIRGGAGGAAGNPEGSVGGSGDTQPDYGYGGTGGGGGGGGGGGCIGCSQASGPLPAGTGGTGEHEASDGVDGDGISTLGNGGAGGDGYYRLILT